MQPISVTVGAVSANDQAVAAAQSVTAAGNMTLTSTVVTFSYAAQLIITTNADYSALTFTITGTGPTNNDQTEVITGPNNTSGNSTLYWKSIKSVYASGGVGGGAVKVGTTGLTTSRWITFDSFASAQAVCQIDVTGTVNFTVQTTMDNPNDPFAPATLVGINWVNDPNLTSKSATTTSTYTAIPTMVRIVQNSGTGSVIGRFTQFSNAPY